MNTLTEDVEQYILGILLQEPESIEKTSWLTPECFEGKNRAIYKAISELYNKNMPVDMVSVAHYLGAKDMPYYLAMICSKVAGSGNVEHHSRILFEKYVFKTITQETLKLHEQAKDPTTDPLDLLAKTSGVIEGIYAQIASSRDLSFIKQVETVVQDIISGGHGAKGIPTGYVPLDDILGGRHKGDLHIIAARPGMGKTTYMLQEALSMARGGYKVGIFSLEMQSRAVIVKALSNELGIKADSVKDAFFSDRLNKGAEAIKKLDLYLDDFSGLSLAALTSRAKGWHRKGLDIIYIDYLQLITNAHKGANREQEVASISRGLKGLAKDLDVPVVCLAQLSRSVEQRKEKTPLLSDVRESGSIEQDADTIEFLYRPSYYGIMVDEDGKSTDGILQVIVAKNRNGETGEGSLFHNFAINQIYSEQFDLSDVF